VLWCPSEMPDWGDEGPPWERTGEGEGEPAEGEPAEGEVEPPELPDCATLCTKVVMCSPEMPAEDCLRGCATSFALLPPEQAAAIGECILTTPCEAVEGTDLGEYCMGGGGGGKEGEGEGEGEGDKEGGGSMASLACAIGLTNPGLSLGPFTLGMLPILPSRAMYLDFIDTWSDAQAGKVRSLDFRVPELPPHADHVDVPPYGVATFFNDEVITADPDDAFSYCESDEYEGFVFRPESVEELLPVEMLPDWHGTLPGSTYELGIVWDFPFLLHLEYEAVGAIAVSAFTASVPFGFTSDAEQDLGSELWHSEELPMAETLAQCRRFCDYPTFDSAGVYQVGALFRDAYRRACYVPRFPRRGDSGFPRDP